jgi:hypothetical protein
MGSGELALRETLGQCVSDCLICEMDTSYSDLNSIDFGLYY